VIQRDKTQHNNNINTELFINSNKLNVAATKLGRYSLEIKRTGCCIKIKMHKTSDFHGVVSDVFCGPPAESLFEQRASETR
jgi:hypothetical protein